MHFKQLVPMNLSVSVQAKCRLFTHGSAQTSLGQPSNQKKTELIMAALFQTVGL